jgi:virulence-associated protein VagC
MDVLPSRVFMNGNSQAVRIPAESRLARDPGADQPHA